MRSDVQNAEIKNLGLSVWERLFELDNFRSWAAIGISEIAKKSIRFPACRLENWRIITYLI